MPSILRNVALARLDARCAEQLAEFAKEVDGVQPERFASKLPGDEKALRGIPAIGRGVAGAIPRTRPGDGLRFDDDE